MKHSLTVGDFRQLTEHLAADTPIVLPDFDHSYRHGSAVIDTALFSETITEDHGESVTPEAEFGKRRKVVVVR